MSRPKYVQPNAIPKEKVSSPPYLLKPSLVIDDSCLVSRDLDNCAPQCSSSKTVVVELPPLSYYQDGKESVWLWGILTSWDDFCYAGLMVLVDHVNFAIGCNSSFVALIPKILDPKRVCDYRPISLIGCLYKVVTKILASRLSTVISDLNFRVQSAMIFKVDFAKAYDSIRWDFLEDVLTSFGFGPQWCSWIRGSLKSGKSSILVNGSPTTEFHWFRGLKHGDPIARTILIIIGKLFICLSIGLLKLVLLKVTSSTPLSLCHICSSLMMLRLFIGEWSQDNLKGIMHSSSVAFLILSTAYEIISDKVNFLVWYLRERNHVIEAAKFIGCSTMKTPFRYLGILVGDNMANLKAWDETIAKMIKRLSKWKLNTLSIGGRLTLLKSVLGSTLSTNEIYLGVSSLFLSNRVLSSMFLEFSFHDTLYGLVLLLRFMVQALISFLLLTILLGVLLSKKSKPSTIKVLILLSFLFLPPLSYSLLEVNKNCLVEEYAQCSFTAYFSSPDSGGGPEASGSLSLVMKSSDSVSLSNMEDRLLFGI
ncbi:RNA-directed DNA polymerase, eukaryota [Tanacetum coccineum]|uniref:RNA-directed DNA polymerase, eukaryota n=1 Tax=Tanacetum coccineum TaxID=301880 RepID=A0ABQ4XRG9_9ASTR